MATVLKKICLLGKFAVGKTSLVRRFVEGFFEENYLSTIGTRVSRKQLIVRQKGQHPVAMTLMVWDITGGEGFNRVMRSYYQGAAGGILVCDLTRSNTADALIQYAEDFRKINPGVPLVVVANKADLSAERVVSDETLSAAAAKIQAVWLVSSAKTGDNVEIAFHTLAERILQKSN